MHHSNLVYVLALQCPTLWCRTGQTWRRSPKFEFSSFPSKSNVFCSIVQCLVCFLVGQAEIININLISYFFVIMATPKDSIKFDLRDGKIIIYFVNEVYSSYSTLDVVLSENSKIIVSQLKRLSFEKRLHDLNVNPSYKQESIGFVVQNVRKTHSS